MSLPRLEYHLVNAFTTGRPHSGNQASVVIFPSSSDPRAEDEAYLLKTAQDFGFSETAYLVPLDEKAGRWGLRWFTTEVEVPICGHATLASAKVILSRCPELPQATFETRYWGQLIVKRRQAPDANTLKITISLSTLPEDNLRAISEQAESLTADKGADFAKALGLQAGQVISVGEFKFVDRSYIVEIAPDIDLASLQVDPKDLVPYSPDMTIVTQMQPDASSPGRLTTHTRVFCEHMEDPVTGSAHAFITGYYLLTPASKRIPASVLDGQSPESLQIDGRQLSRRGGKLGMKLADKGLVDLTGTAVEWGRGSLTSW